MVYNLDTEASRCFPSHLDLASSCSTDHLIYSSSIFATPIHIFMLLFHCRASVDISTILPLILILH